MIPGTLEYVPFVFPKIQFAEDGLEAATQEESIDFQTSELTASIMRDDSTYHCWKKIGEEQTTEALAEAVVKALLA